MNWGSGNSNNSCSSCNWVFWVQNLHFIIQNVCLRYLGFKQPSVCCEHSVFYQFEHLRYYLERIYSRMANALLGFFNIACTYINRETLLVNTLFKRSLTLPIKWVNIIIWDTLPLFRGYLVGSWRIFSFEYLSEFPLNIWKWIFSE